MKYRAVKFYSEVFQPEPDANPGGVPGPSRWLIMQIDTFNPYDWVAVSRDFRFSQFPYVDALNEIKLKFEIQNFVNNHEVVYGRNMFIDSNKEPWAISGRKGSKSVGLTGAYDGVMYVHDLLASGTNEVQRIENDINEFVRESSLGPIDPPSWLAGYTKLEGLDQINDPFIKKLEAPKPAAATDAVSKTETVTPWQLPSSEDTFVPKAPTTTAGGSTGTILIAGVALAAAYLYAKNKA